MKQPHNLMMEGTLGEDAAVRVGVISPSLGGAMPRHNASAWPLSVPRVSWQSFGLIGVVAIAAFFNFWRLTQNGYGNTYYAAAVRSMTQSWHNFFFASYDPAGFITVDKPPVSLWIASGFAKAFGFSSFSIMVPGAIAGMASIVVLYFGVSRVFGKTAGLIAGLALAVTPITVAVSRDNLPDNWLILFVLIAAYAVIRANERGSLRWLAVSALFVGVAFNTKSLAAYVALPALWLAYLAVAPVSWKRRVRDLAAATAILVAVSGAWVAAVDLTPASARPYVGGSTNNSELNLLLNYNGLGRIDGSENNVGSGSAGAPGNGNAPGNGDFTPPAGFAAGSGMPSNGAPNVAADSGV